MISLVIIVKNDPKVEDTLKRLREIDKPEDIEIIVIDASTNKKLDYLKNIYTEATWITYIKTNQKKRYTIPEQRNLGIKSAKGEIIVFTDASCIPEMNWLPRLLEPIYNEGEVITVGPTQSIGKPTLNDLYRLKNAEKKYVEEYPTINMAFNRTLIDKIGYFDEQFDYGSDMDFTWRIVDAGFKIRYVATAVVSHDWGNTKAEFKRTILYGEARARLYFKHKDRWKKLIFHDPLTFVYPLLILSLPITLVFPFYPLVFLALVLKNIKEPKPVNIVIKHIVFGLGVIKEVFRHILNL